MSSTDHRVVVVEVVHDVLAPVITYRQLAVEVLQLVRAC
jgi:hypothetical protein